MYWGSVWLYFVTILFFVSMFPQLLSTNNFMRTARVLTSYWPYCQLPHCFDCCLGFRDYTEVNHGSSKCFRYFLCRGQASGLDLLGLHTLSCMKHDFVNFTTNFACDSLPNRYMVETMAAVQRTDNERDDIPKAGKVNEGTFVWNLHNFCFDQLSIIRGVDLLYVLHLLPVSHVCVCLKSCRRRPRCL